MAEKNEIVVGSEVRGLRELHELTGHDFAVILEDLHFKFSAFGEALQSVREDMHHGFDRVDAALDRIITRPREP